VLEFTGIRQEKRFLERELKNTLNDWFHRFLLELGKGFSSAARQRLITIDGQFFSSIGFLQFHPQVLSARGF
jgi:predicted nuclease of restriction endonuclease-like (RecB) superfamily